MDVRSYQEIKALFHTEWDPAILDVVAEAPCRFTDLARRLRRDVDLGLADGTLGRSLARLQRHRLIRPIDNRDGGRVGRRYQITDRGRQKLAIYHAIIEAYHRTRLVG